MTAVRVIEELCCDNCIGGNKCYKPLGVKWCVIYDMFESKNGLPKIEYEYEKIL